MPKPFGTDEDKKAIPLANQLRESVEKADEAAFFQALQNLSQINYQEITNPAPVLEHLLNATYHNGFHHSDPFRYKQMALNYAHVYAYVAFMGHQKEKSPFAALKNWGDYVQDNKNEINNLKQILRRVNKSETGAQQSSLVAYQYSLDMMQVALEVLLDPERHQHVKKVLMDFIRHGILARLQLHAIGANATVETGIESLKSVSNLVGGSPNIGGAASCFVNFSGLAGPMNQFKAPASHIKEMAKNIAELATLAKNSKDLQWYIDSILLDWNGHLVIDSNRSLNSGTKERVNENNNNEDNETNIDVDRNDGKEEESLQPRQLLENDIQQELYKKRKGDWHILYAGIESLYKIITRVKPGYVHRIAPLPFSISGCSQNRSIRITRFVIPQCFVSFF